MSHTPTIIAAVVAAIVGAGSSFLVTQNAGGGASDDTIKNYIMANPQVIMESVNKWQEEQRNQRVAGASEALKDADVQKALYEDGYSAVIGNADAKVTVVEFFDYNCPACKMAFKAIEELHSKDKDVKIIFKEYPIFGPVSDTNSKIGLAVNKLAPGKYFDFHKKMMTLEGRADEATAIKFATEVGVKEAALKAEIAKPEYNEYLAKERELGGKLGIQGTPSLVIGDELVPYALDYNGLEAKVAPLR